MAIKITQKQLRQIIKEELNLLNEEEASKTSYERLVGRYAEALAVSMYSPFGTHEETIERTLDKMISQSRNYPQLGVDVAQKYGSEPGHQNTLYEDLLDDYTSTSNPLNDPDDWPPIEAKLFQLGIDKGWISGVEK